MYGLASGGSTHHVGSILIWFRSLFPALSRRGTLNFYFERPIVVLAFCLCAAEAPPGTSGGGDETRCEASAGPEMKGRHISTFSGLWALMRISKHKQRSKHKMALMWPLPPKINLPTISPEAPNVPLDLILIRGCCCVASVFFCSTFLQRFVCRRLMESKTLGRG